MSINHISTQELVKTVIHGLYIQLTPKNMQNYTKKACQKNCAIGSRDAANHNSQICHLLCAKTNELHPVKN